MATIKSNSASILRDDIKKYFDDFYDGKIPIPCDDECPEGCDGKHGNYECVTEFEPIFIPKKHKRII